MSVTGQQQGAGRTLLAMALIALAVLPYLQTLSHDFVNYDDDLYVEHPSMVIKNKRALVYLIMYAK